MVDTKADIGQSGAMSDHGRSPARWHDAAALASFAFYEPSNGSARWAGGFASDGSQLEVITVVDGDEVSVESARPDRALPDGLLRRVTIANLVWRHALDGDAELTLPYSVVVEADDRTVTVDGEMHPVHGMRVAGERRWVGTMRLADVSLKIATTSSAALELRTCTDTASFPEFPPSSR